MGRDTPRYREGILVWYSNYRAGKRYKDVENVIRTLRTNENERIS